MRKLIKLGVLNPGDFCLAEGDEALYAPTDLPERHQDPRGFVKDGSLRGVPVVWETTGYYEPETDCNLPSALLARWRVENETDWEAVWRKEQAEQAVRP